MLIGAVIGVTVVILYFIIDYVGTDDKRLYFIDHRDTFFTLLTMGVLIGIVTGIGWAIKSKHSNEQTPQTERKP
jgi:cytochrome bd-type quinol oxidase subunit 1